MTKTAKIKRTSRTRALPTLVDWYAAQAPEHMPSWYVKLHGNVKPALPEKSAFDFLSPEDTRGIKSQWYEFTDTFQDGANPAMVKRFRAAQVKASRFNEAQRLSLEREQEELFFNWRVHYGMMMAATREAVVDEPIGDGGEKKR